MDDGFASHNGSSYTCCGLGHSPRDRRFLFSPWCAGYLGHPFRKIGDLCQNIENGQVSSMNRQVDTWATRQKDDVFFLSWKEIRRGRTITRNTLDTVSHYAKSLSLTFGVYDFHGLCYSLIIMVKLTEQGG